MSFAIEISEVSPAEYPLLEVLRDTVFGEFGHHSSTPIATSLAERADLLVLIAHLEGNPIGFSAGYRRKPGVYYVNFLAILRDYRNHGLGRQLLQRHENAAKIAGYRSIEFNTFNHFPLMLRLGLSMRFRPIGVEQHEGTGQDLAIRFGKSLWKDPSVEDLAEIERLKSALEKNQQIVGVVRDEKTSLLQTLVRPAIQSAVS